MRLTNTLRQAFVKAAMDDVPSRDYCEEIRVLARKAARDALPKAVQAVYDNEETRGWVVHNYVALSHADSEFVSMQLPVQERASWRNDDLSEYIPGISAAHKKQLEQMFKAMTEQSETRAALYTKLEGAANAVTTRKALAEMLPEFEKYLPADEAKANRNLPVVANIVAEFTKAGWPKGAKRAKLTAAK